MRTLASDTTPEAEAVLISKWRAFPPARKMRGLAGLRRFAEQLMVAGIRMQFPQVSEAELRRQLLRRRLGTVDAENLLAREGSLRNGDEEMLDEPTFIVTVAQRLEQTNIPYFVSGSVASIIHGEERNT